MCGDLGHTEISRELNNAFLSGPRWAKMKKIIIIIRKKKATVRDKQLQTKKKNLTEISHIGIGTLRKGTQCTPVRIMYHIYIYMSFT